jgi:hypothetical protein
MVGGIGVCHPVGHGHGGVGVVELKQPARDCGYDRLSRAATAMAEAGVPEEA